MSNRKNTIYGSLLLVFLFLITACKNDNISVPKPRAYPKVDFIKKDIQSTTFNNCPFSFDFPSYGELKKAKTTKGQVTMDCWFDIHMKAYNARIHCSYIPINKQEDLESYVKDAFTISGQINKRSDYMSEELIQNANGVKGLMMRFEGPAASPCHFYLTDEKEHFLKASLYFDTQVNPDSLAPITQYLLQDVDKMIASFKWKR
jgi:gliding motility-associated lipoprotein GldD